jgi:hypothetical protein
MERHSFIQFQLHSVVQSLQQVSSQISEQLPRQFSAHSAEQEDKHSPEQLPEQPSQAPVQSHQQLAASTGCGETMPIPKKAAADPASAFFEESSRNLRRVTFSLSFSFTIISFTLGSEKST